MTNYDRLKTLKPEQMAKEIKLIANWDVKQKRKANKNTNFYIDWLNNEYEDGSSEFPYSTMPIAVNEDKLSESIKLLSENDYVVIKLTEQNKKDIDACTKYGDECDCMCCSCSRCILND